MRPPMPLKFAPANEQAIPVHVIEQDALEAWRQKQNDRTGRWIEQSGFTAGLGQSLLVPGQDGNVAMVLAGYGAAQARARGRFHLAAVAAALPEGTYDLHGLASERAAEEALGWLLSGYAFDRYKEQKPAKARLVAPGGVDAARIEALVAGEYLTRDLINTPAADMGPVELEAACAQLAEAQGAAIEVTRGEALLEGNFPMIHTVGRAAAQAPRLIDMRWGQAGPKLTLVGKGGAATVLGLAQMIMTLGLPVQLRVLIPAVENAVSGNSFRPGDNLTARNGLTVEINNTDAEGRLVLADALAL